MKFVLFFIIFYTCRVVNTDSKSLEYFNPNDEDDKVTLWKAVFTKLNTIIKETEKVNKNVLDLSERFDDLYRRQEGPETQTTKLVEIVDLNSNALNESLLVQSIDRLADFNNKTEVNEKPLLKNSQTTKILPYRGSLKRSYFTKNKEWTAILRRQDGSVNFYRNWTDYKNGFGDPNGEFFMGLEQIHFITTYVANQELLVILEDWQNQTRYARYDIFRIGSESEKYKLIELGAYSGDAEDSLKQHNGMKFTTADQDNDSAPDRNCAKVMEGAWWYYDCYFSHLAGPYKQESESTKKGIEWVTWKDGFHSLKSAEMLIRALP